MHHYLYETVNKVNGKYYVGIHSTNDLNDGYLGSGSTFKNALKRHGRKNFEKRIFCFLPTKKAALKLEAELVVDPSKNRMCYNVAPGGLTGMAHTEEAKAKISSSKKGIVFTAEHRAKISAALKGRTIPREVVEKTAKALKGRKFTKEHVAKIQKSRGVFRHTEEAKAKMSASHKARYQNLKKHEDGLKK